MKNHIKKLGVCASLGIIILIFTGCSDTPFSTAPTEDKFPESVAAQGLTSDQITWISWKQEVVDQIKVDNIAWKGSAGKLIKANKGGKVGGGNTFHNKVKIPKNALEDDTYITVEVLCVEDDEQCGAGVDFLPNMQFLKNVEITLSYAFLDLDEEDEDDEEGNGNLNFQLYYSENSGETWFPVGSDVEIDYDKKTITFEVNHFTRYSWGL